MGQSDVTLYEHTRREEIAGHEVYIYQPRFSDREVREIAALSPAVSVPNGVSGAWRVERHHVSQSEADAENAVVMAVFIAGAPRVFWHGAELAPGAYTRLTRNGLCIMSDTLQEVADHVAFVRAAQGHVLISGLGLGAALQACLRKPEVTHATVIERSQDVLALVGPHYQALFGDRLTLICADALHYRPPAGARYGAVWHDIWDDITPRYLPQMEALHRVYAPHTGWQDSWGYGFSRFLVAVGWTVGDYIIKVASARAL